jgi:hypothetical protein
VHNVYRQDSLRFFPFSSSHDLKCPCVYFSLGDLIGTEPFPVCTGVCTEVLRCPTQVTVFFLRFSLPTPDSSQHNCSLFLSPVRSNRCSFFSQNSCTTQKSCTRSDVPCQLSCSTTQACRGLPFDCRSAQGCTVDCTSSSTYACYLATFSGTSGQPFIINCGFVVD